VQAKEAFGFRYNSDCRGTSIFRPVLADGALATPQIPVDLPTYDELVSPQLDAQSFNDDILRRFAAWKLNVYTVHAEVEGIVMAPGFRALLGEANNHGIQFQPLGALLPDRLDQLPAGQLVRGALRGREGWLGVQR